MAFVRGVAVAAFHFGLRNRVGGAPVTTGSTIGYITKGTGAQAVLTDTPVHVGNGQWRVAISAAEMDADTIGLMFVNSTAIPEPFEIKTVSQAEADAQAGPQAETGESTLSYCYLELRHEVALKLGYGRSVFSPLHGSVSITSGVATLTGGLAWPLEAADMRRQISSGAYTVNTRDSDTQLTLDDLSISLTGGSLWELHPWTDNDLTDIDTSIIRGVRQFYAAYQWSFLRQLVSLNTSAPYETGTITVVDGIVTLAVGTWPSWADEGELVVDGISYPVDSRDSDTQITLDDTTADVDAGTSYSLVRPQQSLPDHYGGFEGPLTYRPGTTGFYEPIQIMSEVQLREARMHSDTVGRPRRAFIRPKSSDGAGGQRWEIGWYPVPDDAHFLYGKMRVHPNRLTFSRPCPLGGMVHGEAILESCLAIAESKLDDTIGVHQQRYQLALASSIELDKRCHTPEYLGVNRDPSDRHDGHYLDRRDNVTGYTQYEGHDLYFG
jgi:hypothetical protein